MHFYPCATKGRSGDDGSARRDHALCGARHTGRAVRSKTALRAWLPKKTPRLQSPPTLYQAGIHMRNTLIVALCFGAALHASDEDSTEYLAGRFHMINVHAGWPITSFATDVVGAEWQLGSSALYLGGSCMEIGVDWVSGDILDSSYMAFSFLTLAARYVFNNERPRKSPSYFPLYCFFEARPLAFYQFPGGQETAAFHYAGVPLKTGFGIEIYWHRIAKLSSGHSESLTRSTTTYTQVDGSPEDRRPLILKILNPSFGIRLGYLYRPSYLDPTADRLVKSARHDALIECVFSCGMSNVGVYRFR